MKRSILITVLMVMMWWLAVPCAHGEAPSPDSARMEIERNARIKDSLYNKTFGEAQAKYDAAMGNNLLQEENHSVSRSRIYIIIIGIMLLAVAVVLVVRQRRLIALQKQRLSEEARPLKNCSCMVSVSNRTALEITALMNCRSRTDSSLQSR